MEIDPDQFLKDLEDELIDEIIEPLDPTIKNVLEKTSLKWIFVGGKGGVGKTTSSCSIATLLASVRESVLIISTDPAHNLSDAFSQRFSKDPTLVDGFENLYAMEIEPTLEGDENDIFSNKDLSFLKQLALSIPGIDEAMGFAAVMRLVQSMKFDVIVFDTAPTGHTLRLLSLPNTLNSGFDKILKVKNKFSGIFSQISGMFGGFETNAEDMEVKLEQTKQTIEDINTQFKNPDLTTFICVCIPEFLSVYETERLVQELKKFRINVDNIIINQVLFPEKEGNCKFCNARVKMQKKYIDLITDLYEHFHVTKMPLQDHEIRGTDDLKNFARILSQNYEEIYNNRSH